MPPSNDTLEELRREIDQIDDSIHDLLMRRALVVERVGVAKGRDQTYLRPGREAVILRRLAARHTGSFPLPVLVRMWREMITALTRLQGPFAVAVYAPEDRRGFWDVARDHFGSAVPMTAVNTPVAAVRAVGEGTATVGVVPYPAEDDSDPWWRFLANGDARTPRVVARLPFGGRGNARGEDRDALVIAHVPHEPTGDDRTLLSIELGQDLSRGRLKDALEACGLPPTGFCTWHARDTGNPSLHLVEIADYIDQQDPRPRAVVDRLADMPVRINTLGGYAVPLQITADVRRP
ncbi:chorismate mutase [Azospirillum halopraeferens]|uniref:chorismate mutase n=1 Tax=Azospirillum halopraeferens TaxID=34010 RepID=UPI0004074D51|nr:chorismate mutase [Azospirillum halopraeferens]